MQIISIPIHMHGPGAWHLGPRGRAGPADWGHGMWYLHYPPFCIALRIHPHFFAFALHLSFHFPFELEWCFCFLPSTLKHTHTYNILAYIQAGIQTHTGRRTIIHTHIIHTHICNGIHTHKHTCIQSYTHAGRHTYTPTNTYTHTCTHAGKHTHIHTQKHIHNTGTHQHTYRDRTGHRQHVIHTQLHT